MQVGANSQAIETSFSASLGLLLLLVAGASSRMEQGTIRGVAVARLILALVTVSGLAADWSTRPARDRARLGVILQLCYGANALDAGEDPMTRAAGAITIACIALMLVASRSIGQDKGSTSSSSVVAPPWAYPVAPAPPPGAPQAVQPADDGKPRSVAGSDVKLTLAQVRDLSSAPDWHPGDHPPMPDIVKQGRKPDVRVGCGYCHYPNGRGRPENASLAGLPAAYIVQQMADYKHGRRQSAEPRMGPPALMAQVAKGVTDEEVRIAAEYFSKLKWTAWIRVIETDSAPKSRLAGGLFVPIDGNGHESLGQRILEMPQDVARTELRDSQSPFDAYVPKGSIKKGETLARTGGNGKTTACAKCHGPELRGTDTVPGLAGRSPSYAVRQLFDFQRGARNGPGAEQMKAVVEKLTLEDFITLAAYTASIVP